MNIKMLNGNILTELQIEEKNTGLYIPDNKAYKIVKVVKSNVGDVKEGSLLYVPKSAGTQLDIDDNNYVVVNIREIILIV